MRRYTKKRKRDPYRRRHKLHLRQGPEAQLHLSPLRRAAGDACAGHTSDYSLPAGAARRARDARILAAIRCMGDVLHRLGLGLGYALHIGALVYTWWCKICSSTVARCEMCRFRCFFFSCSNSPPLLTSERKAAACSGSFADWP